MDTTYIGDGLKPCHILTYSPAMPGQLVMGTHKYPASPRTWS